MNVKNVLLIGILILFLPACVKQSKELSRSSAIKVERPRSSNSKLLIGVGIAVPCLVSACCGPAVVGFACQYGIMSIACPIVGLVVGWGLLAYAVTKASKPRKKTVLIVSSGASINSK